MATPTAAFGAALQIGDGASPEAFATIAAVKSINGLNLGNDTAETTTHDAANRYRTFVATLKKQSNISCSILYDQTDSTHAALTAAAAAITSKNYKLVLNDTGDAVFSFAGIVENFEFQAEVDGLNEASLNILVTGAITES